MPLTPIDTDVELNVLDCSHIVHCRSKTPGGRLVYLYIKKRVATPKCPSGMKLSGVSWTPQCVSCTHKNIFLCTPRLCLLKKKKFFFPILDSSSSAE